MNFPPSWISWIQTCLESSSFSVIIKCKPTSWFTSSRCIRQGDPISSYLFILVSQILTSMLNHNLINNLIPGFSGNLNHNFNHLMYADDLILVTTATRQATRNINYYLAKYTYLTSQRPNISKFQIFFPA